MKKILLVLLALVVLAVPFGVKTFKSSYVRIPQKHAGYKMVWGEIQPRTYGPGHTFIIPFTEEYGNEVKILNVQPRNYKYDFDVKTKDLQTISLNVSVLQEPNPEKLYIMANQFDSYESYQKEVVQDLLNSTMVALCGLTDIWTLVGGYEQTALDAVNYIINDQLMQDNYVHIRAVRMLGFKASPEFEALLEKTAQTRQEISIEELKAQKAAVETKRVLEEAKQNYERLAAIARANGIDVQIKAEALKNPYVAWYEVAKALQTNWNGEFNLPQTLTIMEASNKGLPVLPFMNLNNK